jgi:hypothetical protein
LAFAVGTMLSNPDSDGTAVGRAVINFQVKQRPAWFFGFSRPFCKTGARCTPLRPAPGD